MTSYQDERTEALLVAMSNMRAFHWERFAPSPAGAFPETCAAIASGSEEKIRHAAIKDAERQHLLVKRVQEASSYLDACESRGVEVLLPYQSRFPAQLRAIENPPFVLFAYGNNKRISSGVGIVGSREPSEKSLQTTRAVSSWLAENGIPVISGMALGIDAAAIEASAHAGGLVVGIIAGDAESTYPRQNRAVYGLAREHGILLSETTPECPVRPSSFLRRNRLISGFSKLLIAMSIRHNGGTFNQLVWAELQKRPFIVLEDGASLEFKNDASSKRRQVFFTTAEKTTENLSRAWIDPGFSPEPVRSAGFF